MKNLYESILTDIEDTIKQGDDYKEKIKSIKSELKTLKTDLCLVKTFNTNKLGCNHSYYNGIYRYIKICKNLLEYGCQLPADLFEINILKPGLENLTKWTIHIYTWKQEGYSGSCRFSTPITHKKILLPESDYKSIGDLVKNYIKPILTKINNISDFKKNILI